MNTLERRIRASALAGGLCLLPLFATADSERGPDTSPGSWSPEAQQIIIANKMAELAVDSSLITDRTTLEVNFSDDEEASVATSAPQGDPNTPLHVGLNRTRDSVVSIHAGDVPVFPDTTREVSGGVLRRRDDNSLVFTMGVSSDDATGIRLHLSHFNLPGNARLSVYGSAGPVGEVFGPYTDDGPLDSQTLWTPTVFGELMFIEMSSSGPVADGDFDRFGFTIAEVSHLGPRLLRSAPAAALAPGIAVPRCRVDAACADASWPFEDSAARAMGLMVFSTGGGQYVCTGGLLNDRQPETFRNFLLSANHCVDNSDEAASLECIWRYSSTSCGGPVPDRSLLPRTTGARLLAGGASPDDGDYSLLRLAENPPDGSVYLGWSQQRPGNGKDLFRLSFPNGDPLSYSRHVSHSQVHGCDLSNSRFIFSSREDGSIAPGSNGAPVMLADGTVIGQLSARCGTELDDDCSTGAWEVADGAFGSYFSRVQSYLNHKQENCKQKATASDKKFSAGSDSATIDIKLRAGEDCPWEVTTDARWITLAGPTSGTDSGSVAFDVAANNGPKRTGHIFAAGKRFTIKQAGFKPVPCKLDPSVSDSKFSTAGGKAVASIDHRTGSNCSWEVTTDASWISFLGETTGTNNGAVSFEVAPNGGAKRTGHITVAGEKFNIRQEGVNH